MMEDYLINILYCLLWEGALNWESLFPGELFLSSKISNHTYSYLKIGNANMIPNVFMEVVTYLIKNV